MKKIVASLLFITLFLLAVIVYERYFVQSEFGPSTMLAVVLLACFAMALLVTLFSFETRFQEAITRIWLVTISIGLTFIVADLIIGALLIKPLSPELVPDEVRHHKLMPNTYSRFEQRDFSYIQRVNNIGLRGKDTTREKPSNHFRILMLGDSFTMGKGVEDDQTFSALLEVSLNSSNICESTRIEVLNGGVDSYSPILSYLQLSRDLAPLSPDLIILNLDISDLLQETAYREVAVRDDDGKIVGIPGSERTPLLNQRIRSWIDQNLYFTRLILFYTNRLVGHRDLTVQGVVTRANEELVRYTLDNDDTDHREQWEAIFDSISRIKSFADANSSSFALAIYPWGHQVNDQEWVPGRYSFISKDAEISDNYLKTIYSLAEDNDIEIINLFPLFRKHDEGKSLYFNYDMHWTTEGHKVMAHGLERFVRSNYLEALCG